jgi:hypothetical protein
MLHRRFYESFFRHRFGRMPKWKEQKEGMQKVISYQSIFERLKLEKNKIDSLIFYLSVIKDVH